MKPSREPSNKGIPGSLTDQKPNTQPFSVARLLSWILIGLLATQCVVVFVLLCDRNGFEMSRWPLGLAVVLAAGSTLHALSLELPWQNVALASFIIGSISSAVHWLITGFGTQPMPTPSTFWPVPLVWLTAILSARGAARLALARWRTSPSYGLWLTALIVLLVTLFAFGSQYVEKTSEHPMTGKGAFATQWPGAIPGIALLKVAATCVIALLLATPSLINKRPVEQAVDRQPMIIYLLLNAMFGLAALCQGASLAAGIIAVFSCLLLPLAVLPQVKQHYSNSPP